MRHKSLKLLELRFMVLVLRSLNRMVKDKYLNSESEKLQKDLSLHIEEEYQEMGLTERPEKTPELHLAM